jgi:PGF-CTERM protein
VWHAPVNPQPGESVTFVADPTGSIDSVQSYRWDLDGDGSTDARGWAVSHSLGTEGRVAVNLTIEHANGTTETARRTVVVGDPTATPTLTPTSDSGTGENSTFTERATGTDEATEAEGPGFGVSTALFALVILTLLLARRIGR